MTDSDGTEARQDDGAGTGGASIVAALKSKELLLPAAVSAVGAVAVAKGPDLLRRLASATEQEGEDLGERAAEGAKKGLGGGSGLGAMAGQALSKALPGGGGRAKKTRRLPIQRWTDVAVPVEQAYEAWTSFDEFPRFMHRVLDVEETGDDTVRWKEKIWFSTREWEGEITDRRKNDRIAWKTTKGLSHSGVVTFHRLDDRLTRVMVDMDFEPAGMVEKMASGLRFVKRAVQADLARFKAHVELEDAKGLEYRAEKGSNGSDGRDEREQARKERREARAG